MNISDKQMAVCALYVCEALQIKWNWNYKIFLMCAQLKPLIIQLSSLSKTDIPRNYIYSLRNAKLSLVN